MIRIVLSDEQAELIARASQPIDFVDSQGRALGQLAPVSSDPSSQDKISDEELAEAKQQMEIYRREGGDFFTTQEVLEHLKSLGKE